MAKKPTARISARQLAIVSARLAQDRHCTGIVVLDLRHISPVTDYFVIATGTSNVQMRAVADETADAVKDMGHKAFNIAGRNTGKWILLDFIDVVVHLFDDEHRRYYDLELMWGDAPRVAWQGSARRASKGVGETQDES